MLFACFFGALSPVPPARAANIVRVCYHMPVPVPGQAFSLDAANVIPGATTTTIAAFKIRIYFDESQSVFDYAEDISGQPEAGMAFDYGPVTPDNTYPDTTVHQDIQMTTLFNVENAGDMSRLFFTASGGYTSPLKFHVSDADGAGLIDGNLQPIEHTYDTTCMVSSVADYNLY